VILLAGNLLEVFGIPKEIPGKGVTNPSSPGNVSRKPSSTRKGSSVRDDNRRPLVRTVDMFTISYKLRNRL